MSVIFLQFLVRPAKGLMFTGWKSRLKALFLSHAGEFQKVETEFYGKKESIRYYCIDLLWGQKLYQELRFALVEIKHWIHYLAL